MDRNADLLFDFIKNMLYHPEKAALSVEALDDDFQKLGKGLLYFNEMLTEERKCLIQLAKGDLSGDLPKGNELTAPLKTLQANLLHLTWQTKQVAAGDYHQRVDFMGEFAEAFNQMIEQLETRRTALEKEMAKTERKAKALRENIALLESITQGMPEGIIVVGDDSRDVLFSNPMGRFIMEKDERLIKRLLEIPVDGCADFKSEMIVDMGETICYYTTRSFPVFWHHEQARTFILSDISDVRRRQLELENLVMSDALTGMRTRYAGMSILKEWMDQEIHFILSFVDIDRLKYVNDEFGHKEGDDYIITVAQALAAFSEDVVISRIGGDEFMLIARNTDEESAMDRLYEIQMEIEELTYKEENAFRGSISYGVVASRDFELASELLSKADEIMYINKRRKKIERIN